MQIELGFPVEGDSIPADHAYLLYAALSHMERQFHDEKAKIRFSPINGAHGAKGMIGLTDRSRLRIRLPAEQIAVVLPLAGRTLNLGAHHITLRAPTVVPLIAAPTIAAKMVYFKNAETPEKFLATTRWKLDELGVGGETGIPLILQGERAGQPRRQILRIKGRRMVGYALQVAGLTAEESVCLQEQGLGGRCRMGCGFFVPVQPRS